MPIKPQKSCSFPSCPKLSESGYSYCPEHDKKVKQSYNEKRETAVERGYTHRWRTIRRNKLKRSPLCEKCKPITALAVLVHHKDRNPKNNSWDNLQSLCILCHAKEHAKDFKLGKELQTYSSQGREG